MLLPRWALLLVLAAALLAGCTNDAPAGPRTRDETLVGDLHLEGNVERETTSPGQTLVSNFHLTNRGGAVRYEDGGCASAPWVFEIRAENGTLVGPLPPAPGCLGEPLQLRAIGPGEALSHAFSWDANRKWHGENGTVKREPAAPGLYTLTAKVVVERDGVRFEPQVALTFRVEAASSAPTASAST